MNRAAGLAILLVLSNAAWLVAWLGDDGRSADVAPDRGELEETIDGLRAEVAQLRSEGASDAPQAPSDAAFGIDSEGPELVAGGRKPDPEVEEREAARLSAEEREAAEAARAKERQAHAEARAKATAMLEKIMQVKDPGLRQEGLRDLEAALAGTDPLMTEYALGALWAMRDLQMDRSAFRSTVLDLLDSEHAGIRRSALYALHATGAVEGDLRFVLEGAKDEDPVVRRHAARILRAYTEGRFAGEAGEALTALLGDEDATVRKGTLRGLWNARVTPEAEAKLIEIASRPTERYDAVYHGLSTLENKSRRVVDVLFECLEDDNHQLRARAHWGLQRGLSEDVQTYVARRYVDHLEKFLNPKSHGEALKVIARYGDASLVADLERFAGNDMIDERVRQWAHKVAEHLRSK